MKQSGLIRDTENFKMNILFSRRKYVDTIQMTFGGSVQGDEDTFLNDIKLFKHSLRQFFYQRSKDGYYKKKFIFIDKENVLMKQKSVGMLFFDVFLFLEETYERDFLIEYFDTIYPELNQIYNNQKNLKFKKYKDGKITQQKRPQEKS